jgi:fructose transport system substrate-binding protein
LIAVGAVALAGCGSNGGSGGAGSAGGSSPSSGCAASSGGSGSASSSGGGSSASLAGSSSSSAASGGGNSSKNVHIALILKDQSNPYWFSMETAAKQEADKLGFKLTTTFAKNDADTQSQITAINSAVADKDSGIVIALNGPAVNGPLKQAEQAGLTVFAVDTVPTPPDLVDATFATPNEEAGQAIGKYAAAKLDGKTAVIAMLNAYDKQVVSVDVDRNHGFLEGMGIPVGSPTVDGKEPKSGNYTGGKGGKYQIVCEAATIGSQSGGLEGANTCLTKNPDINVIYTINEQAAQGAVRALQNAGISNDKMILVTIDGGCDNLQYITSGEEDATSGQRPDLMVKQAMDAIYQKIVHGNAAPKLKFTNAKQRWISTGTTLYTDQPLSGVTSITASKAKSICWGSQ